ncbi:MAG: aldehyde dehydrogenase family protein, partial [Planctomycetales bacterium]|nr:aldehyde dehydrogenase family protein [Planctomycetales bacterium]
MSTTEQQPNELQRYCEAVALRAKSASRQLALCDSDVKNRWLIASARALRQQCSAIVAANRLDLDAAPGFGLTEAQADRLRLDAGRIDGIAEGLAQVAGLPDPVGELIETTNRPNGLVLRKVRVPLGVVFFVYESRPNVTADAAAICVKSGNAVILRGGKEAAHSSRAIVNVMLEQAREVGLPVDSVQLVEPTDRAAVGEFLSLHKYIDLAIPRGGEGLIRRVAAEATMPVIKHYTGNCHV